MATDGSMKEADKIRCLRVFERCRISYGHSVGSIYRAVNLLDTSTVPVALLSENLHLYLGITEEVAKKLADVFDARNRKEVALEDVSYVLEKYKPKMSMESLINEHPFFPSWLTNRSDFREFFTDWTTENGAPNATIVEMALRGQERKAGDLQLIFKWIKIHKILTNVKDARLLEVCKFFEYLEVRHGMNVVTQGEHGDAFYIILQGSCSVLINDVVVGAMHEGMSFGEKALENDAPRAATIKTLETCKLMVLRSSEYKSLVASAQAKLSTETVEFIHCHCKLFKKISYARLFYMVKKMVRKVFQEGEKIFIQGQDTGGLFLVVSGRVDISRRICATDHEKNGKLNAKARELLPKDDIIHRLRMLREAQHIDVKVHSIRSGSIFGDDTIRRCSMSRSKYHYTATAVANTEIIIINEAEALSYFKEKLLPLTILYSMTNMYHVSGEWLLEKHRFQASKKEKHAQLKEVAFGGKYSDRVQERESRMTRSISTPTLLSHQAYRNSVQAHSKYTKKVLDHMNAPFDRKKIRRRSSLVTFLANKSQKSPEVFIAEVNKRRASRRASAMPSQIKAAIVNKVPSFK